MPSPVPWRQWPLTVRVFVLVVLVWDAAAIAVDTAYFSANAAWAVSWQVLGLMALAALACWRQRWAWCVFLIGPIVYWASPAWGAPFHPFWDGAEVVLFGLLISPSTRRHVALGSRSVARVHKPGRAWVVCLLLSGAIAVPTALTARHRASHSVAVEVIAEVLLWLLVAAAMRLAVFVFQGAARLARRGGDDRPAMGPEG